jgi:(p)ppGpp synthase/HD superfamily hydrolase
MLQQCEEELRQKLTLESSVLGLNFEVQGRLKSLHSMHCKMQRKNVPVSQIYDARAIR